MSGTLRAAMSIEEAAATLKALNPDVILLQQVQDWHICSQLAEALNPIDYQVVVCSAFHGPSPVDADQTQVAMLSKHKAYSTWSEGWTSQGDATLAQGMAFAAIQIGTKRLGFFTALLADPQSGEALGTRLLKEIDSIGHWETNRVETIVIAASSALLMKDQARPLRKTSLAFARGGLIDALEEVAPDLRPNLRPTNARGRGTGDCVFVGLRGFPSDTRITPSSVSDHYPVTCDIELDPEKVTLALDIRAENRREREERANLTSRNIEYWAGGTLALLAATAVGLRISAKRKLGRAVGQEPRVLIQVPPEPNPTAPRRFVLAHPPAAEPNAPGPAALPAEQRPTVPIQITYKLARRPTADQPPAPSRPSDAERREELLSSEPFSGRGPTPPNSSLSQDPEVRQGVISEITRWLKQKLVRRLISDRTELMEVQQIATHMASTLDFRLAKVEQQIQQQSQAYLLRIEELNRELLDAREENRELIRERIAQVKAEIAATRARVLAEANLENSQLRL